MADHTPPVRATHQRPSLRPACPEDLQCTLLRTKSLAPNAMRVPCACSNAPASTPSCMLRACSLRPFPQFYGFAEADNPQDVYVMLDPLRHVVSWPGGGGGGGRPVGRQRLEALRSSSLGAGLQQVGAPAVE